MATLSVDKARVYEEGNFNDCPMITADIIYEGAVVGDNGSGYARPLVAGDPFLGFADRICDNSAGSAGAKYVRTRRSGKVQLSITALAITDVGKPVYASDDDTFTLTAGSNTLIGVVDRWVSTGVGIIMFDTPRPPASIVAGDIGAGAVTLAKLNAGITPSHVIKYAGLSNSETDADASVVITVAGVVAGDTVLATIKAQAGTASILKAVPTTDTITVTLSGNGGAGTIIQYAVLRAAA